MSYCFIDLDGVVCDFVRGAFKFHGKSLPWNEVCWNFPEKLGIADADFWKPLGEDFWANLEPTAEFLGIMETVLSHFEKDKVFLLSSPCHTPGCPTGKTRWVERHLPDFTRRLLLTNAKHVLARRGRLLIDDHQVNCDSWWTHKGEAFLFPRPWNQSAASEPKAVEKLKKFLEIYCRAEAS
jgi:hypothetical protein